MFRKTNVTPHPPLGEGSLPSSGKKQASTLAKENENDEKDLLSVEPKLELWFSLGGSRSFRRTRYEMLVKFLSLKR